MVDIAGHDVSFSNCAEIVQGGPLACELYLDGQPMPGKRFDPSPLPYRDGILVPMRKIGFLTSGYALCFIDPATRAAKVISKTFGYMRLLRVEGDEVEFCPRAYGDERNYVRVTL